MPMISGYSADDAVWARIHKHPSTPHLQDLSTADNKLEDYGSFYWGPVDRHRAREMSSAGINVAIDENPFELTLGEMRFDPLQGLPETETHSSDHRRTGHDFQLIQFRGPIRPAWLEQFDKRGIIPIQYIHPYTYVVWTDTPGKELARGMAPVRWVGDFLPEFRVLPGHRSSSDEIKPAMLMVSRHAPMAEVLEQLHGLGARVLDMSRHTAHFRVLTITAPARKHFDLGRIAGIYSVQPVISATLRDEMSNQSIVSSQFTSNQDIVPGYQAWLDTHGHDGTGVVVSIIDSGILESHADLIDNMVACVPYSDTTSCTTSNSEHGTHVAGAVAGTGLSENRDGDDFLRGQGVAPGAGLVQQRFNSPGLVYDWGDACDADEGQYCLSPDGIPILFREAALSGAQLTNNSWGSPGFGNGYDLPTQQVDAFTRDANPEVPENIEILAVWAVQNGAGDFAEGGCDPASMGSPEEAKNVFAVGAGQLRPGTTSAGTVPNPSNIYSVAPNSAHGPACDGRTVPHIIAPGCFTQSTGSSSNTAYAMNCGTSMAAPVVSGAVAVFIDQYRERYGTTPSPALTKAVFTTNAVNLEGYHNADGEAMGHRPDRFQGYGRLDLDAVIDPGHAYFHLDQQILFTESGQSWSMDFTADDPDEPVRIMLTWTDAIGHGLGGTTPAWVNDLDLIVNAEGEDHAGNAIGSDGWSEPNGPADSKNNMEAVFLSAAQHAGSFDIEVMASNVAGDALSPHAPTSPRQDFALVCYNCLPAESSFTLELQPERIDACIPDSGSRTLSADIHVAAIGTPQTPVELTSSGEPTGVGTTIDPDSIDAPGHATWTWDISADASSGQSMVTLNGNDGSVIRERLMSLNLRNSPDGPALLNPDDGADSVDLQPVFAWEPIDDAIEYQVQIASDPQFDQIVVDQRIASDTFEPNVELHSGLDHFWRVQATNTCGSGHWSEIRQFTTRLQPTIELSDTTFQVDLIEGTTDQFMLEISNVGTGQLAWAVLTDESEAINDSNEHRSSLDEKLSVSPFPLPALSEHDEKRQGGLASRGRVIGFTFNGTVSGISDTGGWASDMAMTITSPDGLRYSVGGYNTGSDEWDFQGSASGTDGSYQSTHVGAEVFGENGTTDLGSWNFEFVNTWNHAMEWSGVSITLHKKILPYCVEDIEHATWLTIAPESGTIEANLIESAVIQVDATTLSTGEYLAYLCFQTNDPRASLLPVPVDLTVTTSTIFKDRFQTENGEED